MIELSGDASGAFEALRRTQAAIDRVKGVTVNVSVTEDQWLRLFEAGCIDADGNHLVGWEEIHRILHPDEDS